MSKKRGNKKTTIRPTKSTIAKTTSKESVKDTVVETQSKSSELLFNKVNYFYILGGILLMVIGFVLMSGGSMPDSNTWDDSIIYSTRRTLIAPIFILAGLVVQILAVFKKTK